MASVFGATSFAGGWSIISYYRTSTLDLASVVRVVEDDADRERVNHAFEVYVEALDHDKSRMFPLAAAELLIGVAMFAMAAGAMGGRPGARVALVQLVGVQAALVLVTFVVTTKVRVANRDLGSVVGAAQLRKSGSDPKLVEESLAISRKLAPTVENVFVAMRSVAAGLVLIGLTRRRSRAYFDPSPGI